MSSPRLLPALLLAGLLGACASGPRDQVAPIPDPLSQPGHVELAGARLHARVYLDPAAAEAAFGFDIRGAGLLPVQITIDNQSADALHIDADQTFLIDRDGQAWPLLSASQASRRVADRVRVSESVRGAAEPAVLLGMAGALVGLAVGVVSGEDVGNAMGKGAIIGGTLGALGGGTRGYQESDPGVQRELARQSLRRDQRVRPGELGYGFLYFPGRNEADSAVRLRLALEIGERREVIQLPLAGGPTSD